MKLFDVLERTELCAAVLQNLSAAELLSCGAVSRTMARVSSSGPVWSAVFTRDFAASPCRLLEAKEAYALRLAERSRRLRRLREQEVAAANLRRRAKRRDRCAAALDALHVRLLLPCGGLAAVSTTVLLPLWLDGRLPGWRYWAVLAPVWALSAVTLAAAATGVWAWRKRRDRDSLMRDIFPSMRGPVHACITHALGGRAVAVVSAGVLLLLGMLLPIMIGLRVDGILGNGGGVSWFAVLSPAWLASLLLCATPCLQWFPSGDDEVLAARWFTCVFFCVLPSAASLLLLCVLLQDPALHMSPTAVVMPLWAADAVLLLVPLLLLGRALARSLVATTARPRDGAVVAAAVAATAAAWPEAAAVWLLVGPVAAFEVLLALWLEGIGSMTATIAFVPLMLLCGYAAVVLCAAGCGGGGPRPSVGVATSHHSVIIGGAGGGGGGIGLGGGPWAYGGGPLHGGGGGGGINRSNAWRVAHHAHRHEGPRAAAAVAPAAPPPPAAVAAAAAAAAAAAPHVAGFFDGQAQRDEEMGGGVYAPGWVPLGWH